MTSPEYQAPTWVNEDHPDFIEGVSPDLGAGYLNQLSGAVEDHGQRLGAAESDVANLQATALDQDGGDARYILQSNAAGFAPAEATANALAGKQPLAADLTALAGLDSATSGTVASDGAGWVKKTYAQLRTALGLATIATSGKIADATDVTTTGVAVGSVPAVTQVDGTGKPSAHRYVGTFQYPVGGQPLTLPTGDGNPSVTHPSLVAAPNGGTWNGYRLWMAYTPYPAQARENPFIVASNNGVDWVEPAGISNPVIPFSAVTGLGYEYGSDPELVFHGGKLVLFHRPASEFGATKESIYRTESSDGSTWPAPGTKVLDNAVANETLLSPTVLVEDNGTLAMWTVNATVPTKTTWDRRTSADGGLTWSAPTSGAVPVGHNSWHITCRKAGSTYYMLSYSKDRNDIVMATSADGLAWAGDMSYALPKSGQWWDVDGYYRSTFLPVPGDPTRFDLWVSTKAVSANDWRIVYQRGVDLIGDAARRRAENARKVIGRADLFTLVDSFDRSGVDGIGTPDLKTGGQQQWISEGVASGAAQISNGTALLATGASPAGMHIYHNGGSPNGTATVDVLTRSTGTTDVGVIVREVDYSNFLYLSLSLGASVNRVRLTKFDAGTSTALATVDPAGLTPGQRYRLAFKVTAAGVLTGYIDDRAVITYTLSGPEQTKYGSATRVGLFAWNDPVTAFDNFTFQTADDRTDAVRALISGQQQSDVQVFTAGGTWTKPAGATTVSVTMIGAGGGGGSGARRASGSATSGAAGGGGGGFATATFRAADLGATEAVTVGNPGAGGAAQTVDDSNGASGTAAGFVAFGTTVRVRANGGLGGGGGSTTAPGVANGGGGMVGGGNGAAATAGAAGGGSATSNYAPGGGGSGGGISATPAAFAGGNGGSTALGSVAGSAGGAINTAATAATGSPAGMAIPGPGAGGGGSSITAAGGAGGAGGNYGGGGGGGGSSLNTFASGAGGAGGPGIVVVISE